MSLSLQGNMRENGGQREIYIGLFFLTSFCFENKLLQGIVDGSVSKPALVQDTNYMLEKTYHIYLGAFGAYLMPK